MFEGLRPTLRPFRGLTRRWRSQAFAGKYAKFVEVALRGGYETHALLLGAVAVLAREPGACEVLTAQAGRVELLLLLAQHEALAPVQQVRCVLRRRVCR